LAFGKQVCPGAERLGIVALPAGGGRGPQTNFRFEISNFKSGEKPVKKKILELRTANAALFEETQALFPEKGGQSPEQRTKYDKIIAEMKDNDETIKRLEQQLEIETRLESSTRPPNNPINAGEEPIEKQEFKKKEEQYRSAFRELLRTGRDLVLTAGGDGRFGYTGTPLSAVPEAIRSVLASKEHRIASRFTKYGEYRDMGITAPYAAIPTSVLVPQGFMQELEIALKWYGDMLNVGTILETSTGQPLPYPTMNDTTIVGEWVGESQAVTGAAVGTSVDIPVSNILLGAWKASTKMVHVSLELLQDSAFNPESFVKDAFAIRLGRLLNTAFTKGNGSGQPYGIIPQAFCSSTYDPTHPEQAVQVVIGDDNATAPDPTTQVGYIDLITLEHSVDKAYRRGAKFMMHDTTVAFLKSLKDKYGRPLWGNGGGFASPVPETILGYPYAINNDMDQLGHTSPATARNTVAFGRLDKYLIRRVKDLAVLKLVERFAEYGQVAFIGFARYDGNLLDAGTHPVKYLQNPA